MPYDFLVYDSYLLQEMRKAKLETSLSSVKPNLHDTTCCQTGCQTGLTTGCIVYTNI